MDEIVKELQALNIGKVIRNEPLSRYTTMKIGGPADLFIKPSSVESLIKVMEVVRKYKLAWRAIGRGSNLLISDQGIEGAVIQIGSNIDKIEISGNEVKVGCGHSLVSLATMICNKGLSGLEFASGIPGSVGGAIYMNAGAHGSDISKILTKAHILFEDGTFKWLTNEEMGFSYRTSILQNKKPGIAVEAVFKLTEGDRTSIVSQMQKNKDYRKETQPWNYPCAGSIFRNPLPHYAGQLIEQAGLKGFSIGGAKISEMHGNFIINAGHASAEDVLAVIQHVKTTIYELYKVKMETEVEIIGRK